MKPPNGKRRLIYSQPGVRCDVVLDDTGLDGPMGRMEYVAGPPDGYAKPVPPTPELIIRFQTETTGIAIVGNDTLAFSHQAMP